MRRKKNRSYLSVPLPQPISTAPKKARRRERKNNTKEGKERKDKKRKTTKISTKIRYIRELTNDKIIR